MTCRNWILDYRLSCMYMYIYIYTLHTHADYTGQAALCIYIYIINTHYIPKIGHLHFVSYTLW